MIRRTAPVVFAVIVSIWMAGCSGKKLTPEEVAALLSDLESEMDAGDPLNRYRHELVEEILTNTDEDDDFSELRKPIRKIVTSEGDANEKLEHASQLIGERAIEALEYRAKKGDSWAMLYLGFCYYTQYSKNRSVSDFEGLDLPEEARPAWSLGKTAIFLGAGEVEPEKPGYWFKRAVRKKNPRAMAMIGAMYANGHEFDQDEKDARKWYERSAEAGDAVGKAMLGFQLASEDPDRAKQLMTEAAESGNGFAMYALAFACRNGTFGEKDYQSWGIWIDKAKDTALMEAAIEVLVYAMPLSYPEFKNDAKLDAVRDQLILTHTLDDYYFRMGDSWFFGNGSVQKNAANAVELYRAAFDLGNAEAAYRLGVAYESGSGVDQNPERAMEMYEEAARRGSPSAAGAILYESEKGNKEARTLVKKLKKEDVDFALDAIEKFVKWKQEQDERKEKDPKVAVTKEEERVFDDPKLNKEYQIAKNFLQQESDKIAKREQELREKLKGVNQEIAAITGGTPTFRSAEEWHKAYTSAEGITDGEFMRRLPPVAIQVETNDYIREEVDSRVIQKAIMETAEKHGVKFATSSPITLKVLVSLTGAELSKDSSEYIREQKVSAYNVIIDSSFYLPTIVQRGDTFHRLMVSPAGQLRIISHRGEDLPHDKIVEYVKQGIDINMGNLKGIEEVKTAEQKAWVKSLWSERDADKMYARYLQAAGESGEQLYKPYQGVTELRPVFISIDNPSNRDGLSSRTLSRYWDREMKEHKFRVDDDSKVGIWHQVFAVWHGWEGVGGFLFGRDVDDNYTFVSKNTFYQVDTVFPLGDKFVRKTVIMDPRFATEVTFLERGLLEKFALKQVNKHFGNLDFLR